MQAQLFIFFHVNKNSIGVRQNDLSHRVVQLPFMTKSWSHDHSFNNHYSESHGSWNCCKCAWLVLHKLLLVPQQQSGWLDSGHPLPSIQLLNQEWPGVTGQSILPAGLYPGLKWPRLNYTRVYYGLGQFIPGVYCGLGQFIPPQAKLYTHDIICDIISVERYTKELFFTKLLRFQFCQIS